MTTSHILLEKYGVCDRQRQKTSSECSVEYGYTYRPTKKRSYLHTYRMGLASDKSFNKYADLWDANFRRENELQLTA